MKEVPEGRAEVFGAEDVDEGEDDEAVINPEDPESPVPGPLTQGGCQESPQVEAGPEVDDSLEETDAFEDCESTEDVGRVTEMKGETFREIKALGQHPVTRIEDPGDDAAPAHE